MSRAHVIIGLTLCAGLAHILAYLGPFEDAFITFRYVHNLLAGHGLAWNPGERVEGFTSLGWVLLLAALGAAGLPYDDLATLLSALFGLALIPATARLARDHRDAAGDRPVARGDRSGPLAGLLVAANGTLAYYAGTGMETTLFAVLVTAAAISAARGGAARAARTALVLFVATLVRPEGVGYSALFAAALFVSGARRDAAILGGVYFTITAPLVLARYAYFGFLLPNTYYAKVGAGGGSVWWAGLLHLERYATPFLVWLALLALAVRLRRSGATRANCIAAAIVLGAMINVVLVGGDGFPFSRIMLPAAPAGAVVLVAALRDWLAERPGPDALAHRRLTLACAALALWTAALGWLPRFSLTGVHGRSMAELIADIHRINRGYFAVGRFLRERAPADTLVALNAAGIVPYVSRLPSLDMLGLNDVHIAHAPLPLGRGMHGHEKYDVDYVLSRRPDIVLLGLPEPTARRLTAEEQRARYEHFGRTLRGDLVMLAREDFHADYRAVQVRIADSGYLVMFMRRGFALDNGHGR